jgi:tetratricopeptide (TPR) repeat protein
MGCRKNMSAASSSSSINYSIKSECEAAYACHAQGKHKEDLDIIDESLSRHSCGILHYTRGNILYNMARTDFSTAGYERLKKAVDSARQALAASPNSIFFAKLHVTLLYELARRETYQDYTQVIEECKRALKVEEDSGVKTSKKIRRKKKQIRELMEKCMEFDASEFLLWLSTNQELNEQLEEWSMLREESKKQEMDIFKTIEKKLDCFSLQFRSKRWDDFRHGGFDQDNDDLSTLKITDHLERFERQKLDMNTEVRTYVHYLFIVSPSSIYFFFFNLGFLINFIILIKQLNSFFKTI